MRKPPMPATTPEPGALRVWYYPQIGAPMFTHRVPDLATAYVVLDALGKCALHEYRERIRGEYADAGGVQRCEDYGEGPQWYSVDDAEIADAIGARRARLEACEHAETADNGWERAVCVACGTDRGLWHPERGAQR